MIRFIALIGLVGVLTGCGARDISTLSPVVMGTQSQTVFFATQRGRDQSGPILGQRRFETLHFGRLTISIPPLHELGKIEWRNDPPDPKREFAVTGLEVTPDPDVFLREVRKSKAQAQNETFVFIHGYNTTAVEAAFRVAQIQQDFELTDPAVLFTWPSAGLPTGYIYDRDSVLFARDDLETALTHLTRGQGRVFLVAHSMGAHLMMETLRQARLRGNTRMLNRISGIVLMAPDLDPDVFRRQAQTIGKLPQPFFIFSSTQDQALSLSSFLTGRKPRLGRISGPESVEGLDVTVLDFSAFTDGERFNHMAAVTSPTAIRLLQRLARVSQIGHRTFGKFVRLTPSAR